MPNLIVVYDACVLYPAPLRDTLMYIGLEDLCQPRWTEQIHEEWIHNLLKDRPDITRERLERTRAEMNNAIEDSVVFGYEDRIQGLELPDPNDRHVLAAALQAEAQLIITNNTRDFPSTILDQYDLEACSPDAFLTRLFDEEPLRVVSALHKQRSHLSNPPKTAEGFLNTLEQQGLKLLVQKLKPNTDLL